MKPGGIFIAAMALAAASPAHADAICADRPGKATPTCTVPAGIVQVETSLFDWARDRSGGIRTDALSIGDTALKLGLTGRLHVELDISPYNRARVRDGTFRETLSGFGDMAIAAKYRLTADDALVQLAVRPFVKIATAKRALGNGKVEGGAAILIDGQVPGTALGWDVAPELDLVADSDGHGYHLATAHALSVGVPLTSRFSISGELWGAWNFDPAGTIRQYSIDGAAAYLLSDNVQLDAGVNFGLNRNTPDVELYSGVAFRF
jgi:hypothetical protein